MALAGLWRAWGVVPQAVVGHSVGEIAAAHIAGILSLADAMRVVLLRGRLMQQATGSGKMASVGLPVAQVEQALHGEGAPVVAAINGPATTVISGTPDAVDEAVARWQAAGVSVRPLPVNYAFHSPQMEPYRQALAAALAGLAPSAGTLPFYSTVTGKQLPGGALDAAYWGRNLREPVRFAAAVAALAEAGVNTFVELSPHPVLGAAIGETLAADNRTSVVVASMRHGRDERATLLAAMGHLYVHGITPAWKALLPAGGRPVDLPTYPWQRQRHWFTPPTAAAASSAEPTLRRVRAPGLEGVIYEMEFSASAPAFVADHAIGGTPVMAATVYLALADAAFALYSGNSPHLVENVEILAPLLLAANAPCPVQVHLAPDDSGASFKLMALGADERWKLHATGHLRATPADGPTDAANVLDIDAVKARCRHHVGASAHYADAAVRGITFGPAFQGVESIQVGDGEALGAIRRPAGLQDEGTAWRFHPALLDAALQPLNALLPEGSAPFLPVTIETLQLHAPASESLWSHVRRRTLAADGSNLVVDVAIYADDGAPVAMVTGLRLQRAKLDGFASTPKPSSLLYTLAWEETPEATQTQAIDGDWLLVGDGSSVATALGRCHRGPWRPRHNRRISGGARRAAAAEHRAMARRRSPRRAGQWRRRCER